MKQKFFQNECNCQGSVKTLDVDQRKRLQASRCKQERKATRIVSPNGRIKYFFQKNVLSVNTSYLHLHSTLKDSLHLLTAAIKIFSPHRVYTKLIGITENCRDAYIVIHVFARSKLVHMSLQRNTMQTVFFTNILLCHLGLCLLS